MEEDDDLWVTPEGVPVPRFTPWIGRNHNPRGWTPARQLGFMRALTRCGSARAAAAAVGKSVRSAYLLRDKPGAASFAAAWDQAAIVGRRGAVDFRHRPGAARRAGADVPPGPFRGHAAEA